MDVIEKNILSTGYAEHFAIFFTDDGVIVDCETSSPLLHFAKTVKILLLYNEINFSEIFYLFLDFKEKR